MNDPSRTLSIMLEHDILKGVLPEISLERLPGLAALIEDERSAGLEADALRRLAALLPPEPQTADSVAVRLRLSNKARKRIVCAAERDIGISPQSLAYRLGSECAADRLLLTGHPREAAEIAHWKAPRLPIGGGELIKRGLAEGPIVARTLRRIEDHWVRKGFPTGTEFDRIVDEALTSAS